MSAEPFLSVGVLINDDTQLTPTAQRSRHVADGVIAAVQIGSTGATAVQSNSPAALRRLAAALCDAADKAEAITYAPALRAGTYAVSINGDEAITEAGK